MENSNFSTKTRYKKAVKIVDKMLALDAPYSEILNELKTAGFFKEEIEEIENDYNNNAVVRG
jgi:hypothetical protein